MRNAALLAVLLALLTGCGGSSSTLQYPEPRVIGNVVSFEGCGYKIGFPGRPAPYAASFSDVAKDYRSDMKRSEILQQAGFRNDDDGTRRYALCSCMKHSVEAGADRAEATAALSRSLKELAGVNVPPARFDLGTPFGRLAAFDFRLDDGTGVLAKLNFNGNCTGGVIALAAPGRGDAAARNFVDSLTRF